MLCDRCGWYYPDGDGTNVGYYTACKSGFPPEKRKLIAQDVMDGIERRCSNFEQLKNRNRQSKIKEKDSSQIQVEDIEWGF